MILSALHSSKALQNHDRGYNCKLLVPGHPGTTDGGKDSYNLTGE